MKKIVVILVLVLMSSSASFAQSVFDKFDGQDDITAVIVNQEDV